MYENNSLHMTHHIPYLVIKNIDKYIIDTLLDY